MNSASSFLDVNMNYHIEHHTSPMMPFTVLPQLHGLIKSQCLPPQGGLIAACREILPSLFEQRANPTHFRPFGFAVVGMAGCRIASATGDTDG